MTDATMIEAMTPTTLSAMHPAVTALCRQDRRFAQLVDYLGEIEYWRVEGDEFPYFLQLITSQMLSTKAADTIYARLAALCGGDVKPATIAALSLADLKAVGLSGSKAETMHRLSEAVLTGSLDLSTLKTQSVAEVTAQLRAIKGVGPWTVNMVLIFLLDRPDVIPVEDLTFRQGVIWLRGLKKPEDMTPAAIKARCARWQPYASFGARYLYRAVDMGLLTTPFPTLMKGIQ